MNDAAPAGPRPARFRLRAVGLHLAITLVLLAAAGWLLAGWFPGLLFRLDGGHEALLLVAATTLAAGPLLSLVAATPGKSAVLLRRDFITIAIIQALVLGSGMGIAWNNRPFGLVWFQGKIYGQPYSAFDAEPDAKRWILAQHVPLPARIQASLPADIVAQSALFQAAAARRSWVGFDASLYAPFSVRSADVRGHAERLARRVVDQGYAPALAAAGVDMAAVQAGRVLLMTAIFRSGDYWLTVDPENGDILSATLALPLAPELNHLGGIS